MSDDDDDNDDDDDIQQALQLVADNDTRWNSVFLMIQRALQLKKSVDLYCLQSTAEKDGLVRIT